MRTVNDRWEHSFTFNLEFPKKSDKTYNYVLYTWMQDGKINMVWSGVGLVVRKSGTFWSQAKLSMLACAKCTCYL